MRAVLSLARVTLAEARAGKLPWVVLLVLAAAAGLGIFTAKLALAEGWQVRIGTTAAVARLGLVAALCLFTVTSVARERQLGHWHFTFARPIARRDYVLGKAAALAALSLGASLAAGALLAACGAPSPAWTFLLWGEAMVAGTFALACAISLSHTVPALAASAAFYLVARSSGALLAMASDADAPVVRMLGLLLPRLDLFARAEWLLYGQASAPLGWLLAQALAYPLLLALLAVVDLEGRTW